MFFIIYSSTKKDRQNTENRERMFTAKSGLIISLWQSKMKFVLFCCAILEAVLDAWIFISCDNLETIMFFGLWLYM